MTRGQVCADCGHDAFRLAHDHQTGRSVAECVGCGYHGTVPEGTL